MITPSSAKAATLRMLKAAGTKVVVTSADGLSTDSNVRARLMSTGEDEIAGAQGRDTLRAILYADDLVNVQRPEKGATVTFEDSREITLEYVDGDTRAVQGVTIAYEVRGAE